MKKICSSKNVVGSQLVSGSKPEREKGGVRSAFELDMCTNSEVPKTMMELFHNLNSRMDRIESMVDK